MTYGATSAIPLARVTDASISPGTTAHSYKNAKTTNAHAWLARLTPFIYIILKKNLIFNFPYKHRWSASRTRRVPRTRPRYRWCGAWNGTAPTSASPVASSSASVPNSTPALPAARSRSATAAPAQPTISRPRNPNSSSRSRYKSFSPSPSYHRDIRCNIIKHVDTSISYYTVVSFNFAYFSCSILPIEYIGWGWFIYFTDVVFFFFFARIWVSRILCE